MRDWFAVLGEFADSLVANDYDPDTLAAYCDYVNRAARIARKDPRVFTPTDVDAVLATYGDRGPAKGMMKRSLRAFYAWAEDRELLVNPARHVRIRKPKTPEAPALERDEMTRLLIAATTVDPRAPWTLMLAYATGARVSALCALRPEDIHHGRVHFVREVKNDAPYSVPMGPLAEAAVSELLALIDFTPRRVAHRLPTLVGVGPNQVWRWCARSGEAAGIHAWPHLFRHTFATDLLDRGADVQTWQALMNHRDLSQLPRYVANRDQRQADAVAALG